MTGTAPNALLEPSGIPRHQSACLSADKELSTVKHLKHANANRVMGSIMVYVRLVPQISSLRTTTVCNAQPISSTIKFQESVNVLLGMCSTGKGSVIPNVAMGKYTIRLQEDVNVCQGLVKLWPVGNARFVLRELFLMQ